MHDGQKQTQSFNVPQHWTFENEDVALAFNQHVREQLPWYDLSREAIGLIARHYITPKSQVYDIGASTGNISLILKPALEERQAKLMGIEPSKAMCEQYKGYGEVVNISAEEFTYEPFSLAVLHLTLQFIAPPSRKKLLETLQNRVQLGGAIIVVDKFCSGGGYFSMVANRMTLNAKMQAGASPEQILKKELSLGGVQRPLDHKDFLDWHPYFRFGDFCGYVFEKH